ncbi:hypothetical protein Tco_0205204 [Tanacetum coccineum]
MYRRHQLTWLEAATNGFRLIALNCGTVAGGGVKRMRYLSHQNCVDGSSVYHVFDESFKRNGRKEDVGDSDLDRVICIWDLRRRADLQFELDEAEALIKEGADLQFELDEAEAFVEN